MEFLWTMILTAAAFFGVTELVTLMNTWFEGEGVLEATIAAVENEYPEMVEFIASTTDAVLQSASSTEFAQ